ncbi:P-type ATPase [Cryptosporidium ubiquitum]|uniref:Phospholipid-transporting ATPase n=1 Tax=Cryptosporidium ubiquitum TaxID=857276 RepID=A0A1J4MKS6_9CRYT|nr:P-type ATPase [Cryptosporidium ubiquitum]OII74051.1 P-type ATPase [Cryptosporidium ubiquitum]
MFVLGRASKRFSVVKESRPRLVVINNRQVRSFSGNFIRTSRYTALNFIPKYLFEQFCRPVNFYFLVISLLQIFPSISSTNGIPTLAFPLVFVLFVGAVKDGWEDLNRHHNDKIENEREVIVIKRFPFINYIHGRTLACDLEEANKPKNKSPSLKHVISFKNDTSETSDLNKSWFLDIEGSERSTSRELKVGDIVILRNHETIPADIVLLSTSSEDGDVFIDTSSLDGESNLKRRFSHKESTRMLGNNIKDVIKRARYLEGLIECSPPGKDLHNFDGTAIIRLPPISEGLVTQGNTITQFPINVDNIVLRGCILRSTEWAIGCIVYAGHESKIQMNSLKPSKKMSNVDKFTNRMVLVVLVILFCLCLTGSLLTYKYISDGVFDKLSYLGVSDVNETSYRATGQAIPISLVPVVRFCTWIVLLANIIPIALVVSMKIVKAIQGQFISRDRAMYDPEKKAFVVARNSDLNEDLGQVRYIFSDKTGTLTRNIMEFKSLGVGGVHYGSIDTSSSKDEDPSMDFVIPQVSISDKKIFSDIRSRTEQSLKIGSLLINIAINNSIMIENQGEMYNLLYKSGRIESAFFPENTISITNNTPNLNITSNTNTKLKSRLGSNFRTTLKSFSSQSSKSSSNNGSNFRQKMSSNFPLYSAQFPDEAALCYGAQYLGVSLLCLNPKTKHMILDAFGELLDVEVLAKIPFNSERKRSSVVVRIKRLNSKQNDKDFGIISELYRERIMVFSKGADSTMLPLLLQSDIENFQKDLDIGNKMANQALRVLCITEKEITEEEFANWNKKYQVAINSVEGRESSLQEAASLIERDLKLQGVTGVEDRLQDEVPETIKCLRDAGIKIWMLTGDKVETAREIAASAGLLIPGYEILELTENTCSNRSEIKKSLLSISKSVGINFELDKSERFLRRVKPSSSNSEKETNFSIIIDGAILAEIFSGSLANSDFTSECKRFEDIISSISSIEKLFVQICCKCHTVIFARFAPSQKGNIVRIVRKHMDEVTLAVGDGANDCNMIQTANIGIGIRGLEGNQAFLTADYGITSFKDLKVLLLVHGRLAYRRICKLALYMFYKNLTVSIPVFIYGFFTLWSGTRLYFDYWYQVYNVILSSVPIIVVSVFDFDVTKSESLSKPHLYKYGSENRFLNLKICLIYLLDSAWHIFVIFTIPYILFGVNSTNMFGSNQSIVGATIYYLVILVVNVKVLLMADHIHYLLGFAVAFSLFSWVCTLFICTASFTIGSDVYTLWIPLYNNVLLWITLISGLSISLWPDYFVKVLFSEWPKVDDK